MSAPSTMGVGGPALRLRGRSYPIVLPKLSDPRLWLASVFVVLHTLGQVEFHFRLSIPQIFTALLTAAALEVGITFHSKRVLLWPASALLTANGIAFIMRVPGTEHGDWWSTRGLWIYATVAAVALLSKYLIKFRGQHVFNPSNLALVAAFLILGSQRTEPLEFWWGPLSAWLVVVLGVIVVGALLILSRLNLLVVAVGFWLTFAAAIGVIALSGHAMNANWHVGPVSDGYFWTVLLLSPEVFIFLSFMITDPKTAPRTHTGRLIYAISIGLLAAALIAPQRTEFGAKVGLLGSLVLICAARPIVILLRERMADPMRSGFLFGGPLRFGPPGRAGLGAAAVLASATVAGLLVLAGSPARSSAGVASDSMSTVGLPAITIANTSRIASIDKSTGMHIAGDVVNALRAQTDALRTRQIDEKLVGAKDEWLARLQAQIRSAAGRQIVVPSYNVQQMRLSLQAGIGQAAPTIVTTMTGTVTNSTYTGSPATRVSRSAPKPFTRTIDVALADGRFVIAREHSMKAAATPRAVATKRSKGSAAFAEVRLSNVAKATGLAFTQGSFRFGMSDDAPAMMGAGVCWLDYNNDGWMDLYAVNSYSEDNIPQWQAHGGLPRSALFRNAHGKFVNVGHRTGTDLQMRGSGCVAADFNGDGNTDLYVTSASDDRLLWNNGNGTFSEGARKAGIVSYGWRSGAAVTDVNGDGLPDLFVAGYTDVNQPIPGSMSGFPTNHQGVRDLLFLNLGNDKRGHAHFREIGRKLGLDSRSEHGLGAAFTDVNGDGRPDLYVANDADPNRLYLNTPWPGGIKADPAGLGFRLQDKGKVLGVDDPNAGMGVAPGDYNGDGRPDLFVTNSRKQLHAAFASQAPKTAGGTSFQNVRPEFNTALRRGGTVGWGDSWVDLNNDGHPDLIVANGAIPVTNLKRDTEPIQVLENLTGSTTARQVGNASGVITNTNLPAIIGRGLAAADFDNNGTVDVAINSIGGPLVLLRNAKTSGHWLEVSLAGFHPGAVVTATLPTGKKLVAEVHAGSSYLSSEDPRIHFGLGPVTRVRSLTVRYPDGTTKHLRNVAADRILSVQR